MDKNVNEIMKGLSERDKIAIEFFKGFMERDKKEKIRRYQVLNRYVKKGQILFTGSSLMEQFPIYEFTQDFGIKEIIYNRGVGGYTSEEMLLVLDTLVYELEPSKIFINIGTNDLSMPNYSQEEMIERYENILNQIMERLPKTKIYVMSFYPMNETFDFGDEGAKQWPIFRTNARIREANDALEIMAEKLKVKYIDVNRNLYDNAANLKPEFSIEGVHMYANGYHAILEDLMQYVSE